MKLASKFVVIVAVALSLINTALAHNGPQFLKAEDAVRLRKASMRLIDSYFSNTAAMIKGEQRYNPEILAKNAAKILLLSGWTSDGFVQELVTSESKSKPAIWKNKADYEQKLKNFYNSAQKLSLAAQKNDLSKVKAPFADLAASCKSCHKLYKNR